MVNFSLKIIHKPTVKSVKKHRDFLQFGMAANLYHFPFEIEIPFIFPTEGGELFWLPGKLLQNYLRLAIGIVGSRKGNLHG